MKTVKFRNEDRMPLLGLGTFRSKPSEVYVAVTEAVRTGYRHIDCAAIYGNEKEVGSALHDLFRDGVVRREDLFITSKLWNSNHAPADVEPALRQTLADLRLDHLDLYLIHWPVGFRKGVGMPESADDLVSLSEVPHAVTWQAMEGVAEKGLARHIGVSNFSSKAIDKLMKTARIRPEMEQIEIQPYMQQDKLADYCHAHQILTTAYSPLGSQDAFVLKDPVIIGIAEKHRCTPAQIVIAWVMKRGIVCIPKSVRPERIRENFGALDVFLDAEDMQRMASLERGQRVIDGKFAIFDGGPYSLEDIWGKE